MRRICHGRTVLITARCLSAIRSADPRPSARLTAKEIDVIETR
jgi:hypothetical protein